MGDWGGDKGGLLTGAQSQQNNLKCRWQDHGSVGYVWGNRVPTDSGDDEKPFNVINNVVFLDIFILFSSCWLSKNAARMPPTHKQQLTRQKWHAQQPAYSVPCLAASVLDTVTMIIIFHLRS